MTVAKLARQNVYNVNAMKNTFKTLRKITKKFCKSTLVFIFKTNCSLSNLHLEMLVEKELRAEEEAVAGSALVDDVSLVVPGFHHRVVLQHNACTFVKATEYGKNLN